MASKKESREPLKKVLVLPKKSPKPDVKHAVLSLFGAPKWTDTGRMDIARWLRRLSEQVRRGTKDLDEKFVATYYAAGK